MGNFGRNFGELSGGINNLGFDEHYIIETRLRTGFDAYTPTYLGQFANQPGVLLVWHDEGAIVGDPAPQQNEFDHIRLIAADHVPTTDAQVTTTGFFPKDATINLQSLNDLTIPQSSLTFDLSTNPPYEYPGHFALTNIHRHKPANPGNPDSDYTVIDTVSLKLTLAAGTIARNSTWKYTVRVVDNLTIQTGTTLTVTPGTQIYVSALAPVLRTVS